MNTSGKNIYVVIGMARSGTSTISRALKTLDIELGSKLAPAEATWNPKGFWEDTDIVYKVNRGVLFALNYTWMSVNRIDNLCHDNKELLPLKKLAKELLEQRFAKTDHWGFKDPRTAKILPFWSEVFSELGLNPHYIIVCRNPLDSAYSYQRVSGSDIEMGLFLWLMHIIPAIEGTQNKNRIVVSYERMLQQPEQELHRLEKHLHRPINQSELSEYVSSFLDNKLRHFSYSDDSLQTHPAIKVAPFSVDLHRLLKKLSCDEMSFDSNDFNAAWNDIKNKFEANYPVYCYLDVWQKRHKRLERELRSIRRSFPWLLTYPLRFIDDKVRNYRRKQRELRRLAKYV